MNRRTENPKRRLHPAVAVLMLAVSVAFVTRTWWHTPEVESEFASLMGFDDDPDMGEGDELLADDVRWLDLLTIYGSYERGTPVRLSFATLAAPAVGVAPSPLGEVAPAHRGRWVGEDPPMLRLGVIMVSDGARRAVLDGQVVGVGDRVADATVVGIDVGAVRLRWRSRALTYDLDSAAPREFRDELLRRRRERKELDAGDGDGGDIATSADDIEGEDG